MKHFSLSRVFGKAHASIATSRLNRPAFRRQRGASAIEYAIIAALVAVAIGALFAATGDGTFGGMVKGLFEKVTTEVNDATA